MDQAKLPIAKARVGASLATLDSREGDDAGALSALDASQSPDLPPDLAEQRLIVRAGSVAHRGDPAGAAAMLAATRTARATETRAQILETASDWAGAEQAWLDCAALTVPESGMLDEAQTRTMLRLATATARAGDDAKLGGLRDTYGARIGAGPLGDMFHLLTAEPIRTSADIERSQRETSLAAALPTDLKALRPSDEAPPEAPRSGSVTR
jgi:sugar/nucleoside kinase (ribokinase family)